MASVTVSRNQVVLSCGNQLRIHRKGSDGFETVITTTATTPVPDVEETNPDKDGDSKDKDSSPLIPGAIIFISISPNSTYLAAVDNKHLHLYRNGPTCVLLSTRETIRRCTKVVFSPDETAVLTADKTGDVYVYSTSNITQPPKLVLGHLSILLDLVFANGGKYIVSSDRDEKIRISHYPNGYNIHAFCLGHTCFVSCLLCVNIDGSEVIISGSGDGTVRFWNLDGKELHCLDIKTSCNQDISKEDIADDSKSADSSSCTRIDDSSDAAEEHTGNDESSEYAVKHICFSCKHNLLAVSFYKYPGIQLHRIHSNSTSDLVTLTSDLITEVTLAVAPWDICIQNDDFLLAILSHENEPLQMFDLTASLQKIDAKTHFADSHPALTNSTELWAFLKDAAEIPDDDTNLRKIKMDYTAGYYERKLQRILGKRKSDDGEDLKNS